MFDNQLDNLVGSVAFCEAELQAAAGNIDNLLNIGWTSKSRTREFYDGRTKGI